MILTVTANTTLDHTVLIPSYQPTKTIRATRSTFGMGGKPAVASWILSEMGHSSRALGLAAGSIGHKVETMLRERGIEVDFVPASGETRINMVIAADDAPSQTTITTNTLIVDPAHLDELRRRYRHWLPQARVVVLGGTLPTGMQPSFYVEFIQLAREQSVPVIFDAAEPNLSAGLSARPTFIKPNQDELSGLVGKSVTTFEQAHRAGLSIYQQYGTAPVITFGAEGALAFTPQGQVYQIPPLPIEVVSAAGAGDAVLAGLASAFERGEPVEQGLRRGFAASTAVCLMPGTGECRREDIERFMPQIQLLPYLA